MKLDTTGVPEKAKGQIKKLEDAHTKGGPRAARAALLENVSESLTEFEAAYASATDPAAKDAIVAAGIAYAKQAQSWLVAQGEKFLQ